MSKRSVGWSARLLGADEGGVEGMRRAGVWPYALSLQLGCGAVDVGASAASGS